MKKADITIVFIRSGIPVYYPTVEESIYQSLKKFVKKVHMLTITETLLFVESNKPDFILVFHGLNKNLYYPIAVLKTKGFKVGVWLTDDPYYSKITQGIMFLYDYIFTQDIGIIPFYEKQKSPTIHIHYLPLAADPTIYQPSSSPQEYHYDICFIGTAFENRLTFIDSIADYLSHKQTIIIGSDWEKLKNYQKIKHQILLLPRETYKNNVTYYQQSKINLNLHRSLDSEHNMNPYNIQPLSINNRTFEIACCSAFQLTDIREDLVHHYIPGKEIETFSTTREFVEKCEYYLKQEEKRKQIAYSGYQRTLQDHTYDQRVQQFLQYIEPLQLIPTTTSKRT